MSRIQVEMTPGQWRLAELVPAEYGPVLSRLAQADGKRLRGEPQLLARAPELLRRLKYRRELAERWEAPETTLKNGWGDCDNIARTVAALGAARGYPAHVWVGYPNGRSVGSRHAVGVVDGMRGDLSGWSELWQAVRRGASSAAPKLAEVTQELREALESPYWRWALTSAPIALGAPPLPYGEMARRVL